MPSKLEGKKIAILVTDGFERSEMTEPKKALENAGASTSHLFACGRNDKRSSRKPDDIPAFNKKMIEQFAKSGEQIRQVGGSGS